MYASYTDTQPGASDIVHLIQDFVTQSNAIDHVHRATDFYSTLR